MASLDTNCLMRWLLNDIPEYRDRVQALLDRHEPLTVDDAALVEAVFALEHGLKLSRPTIRGFLNAIAAQQVEMNRTLWSDVLDMWQEHPKLSVVDVYLAVKAQTNKNGPVYTFDLKMINQLGNTAAVPPAR